MASLTISCSLLCDRTLGRKKGSAPLVLKRDHWRVSKDAPAENWEVDEVKTIHATTESLVVRAQIRRPLGKPLDAVLKLDPLGQREKAVRNELEAYRSLPELQGNILPKLYGCFGAVVNSTMVTCLVLEYCGSPLEQNLSEINHPLLTNVMVSAATIHAHGRTHGDICAPNILICDEDPVNPVFIGLEFSKPHVCGARIKAIQGHIAPTVEEYGCPELHDLLCRLEIWKPAGLLFDGVNIAKESIHNVEGITYFISKWVSPERRRVLEERAQQLWKELCQERILTYGTEIPAGTPFVVDDICAHFDLDYLKAIGLRRTIARIPE
ncbi:hypothetical protein C8R46DRAFT_1074239 [Mycena filopes]|nr:hypothetical protein C8R46DRAFT_1074239 [Mycena filopes]